MSGDQSNSRHRRRTVLKATVGGAAVPFGVTTTALGSGGSLPVVERRQGTLDDPLDVTEMMQLKFDALGRHEAAGGRSPDQVLNAIPEWGGGQKLVDYTVGIQPNGQPTQHVEVVSDESSVSEAHRQADEKAQAVRERARGDR